MPKYVVARSSAHVGEFEYIEAGRVYYADDPLVLARPDFFTDDFESVPGFVLGTRTAPKGNVEAATANPGEKRATNRK